MKYVAILDESFLEMFARQMRVYLVKTEAEFTRLALLKYREESKLANNQVKSSASSQHRSNTDKTQACSNDLKTNDGEQAQGTQNDSMKMLV